MTEKTNEIHGVSKNQPGAFLSIRVSQGSVVTYVRCGGMST